MRKEHFFNGFKYEGNKKKGPTNAHFNYKEFEVTIDYEWILHDYDNKHESQYVPVCISLAENHEYIIYEYINYKNALVNIESLINDLNDVILIERDVSKDLELE